MSKFQAVPRLHGTTRCSRGHRTKRGLEPESLSGGKQLAGTLASFIAGPPYAAGKGNEVYLLRPHG